LRPLVRRSLGGAAGVVEASAALLFLACPLLLGVHEGRPRRQYCRTGPPCSQPGPVYSGRLVGVQAERGVGRPLCPVLKARSLPLPQPYVSLGRVSRQWPHGGWGTSCLFAPPHVRSRSGCWVRPLENSSPNRCCFPHAFFPKYGETNPQTFHIGCNGQGDVFYPLANQGNN
jgi:hypothetical protein